MTACPFCDRIAAGDYAEKSRGMAAVAFPPLAPVTPGHLLVVPVAHVTDALEDPCITGDTMQFAARLSRELWLGPCNLITSAGAEATQTVMHLHIHIVPRAEGDGLHLPWTGQQKTADSR